VAALGGLLLLTVGLSALGCARDVVMLNPRTGETAVCPASPLNPWSQQQACVGDHIAQGWRRQE
jgi:hypothetical protein